MVSIQKKLRDVSNNDTQDFIINDHEQAVVDTLLNYDAKNNNSASDKDDLYGDSYTNAKRVDKVQNLTDAEIDAFAKSKGLSPSEITKLKSIVDVYRINSYANININSALALPTTGQNPSPPRS